ncbi:3581_t:CDS:1, partial [Acaulospora morrowiae]
KIWGTNANDVTTVIIHLTTLQGEITTAQGAINNALNILPETTATEITTKLTTLIDLRDNHGAGGTPAEQVA